ncbi:hypothetical protein B6U91_00740 [Candidatus Pacearchaeota archaeon ex4484_71]|nr:MAG: hypothetical protein B6U91_00740 [Candidatus Pacearchaeota archaeon ex4484_71]
MRSQKRFYLVFAFLIMLVSFSSFLSASYFETQNVKYYLGGNSLGGNFANYDDMCTQGTDFILQIDPAGCTPPVVRSDLLEEQNVYVFCPIKAIKINPLIDVKAIKSMTFGGQYSEGVSSVGFYGSRSALGYNDGLNSFNYQNVGYAVIGLRRNPNESSMPDFVEGNITASIRYDIENAFGVRRGQFFLPVLSDSEWALQKDKYYFWDGRGYLRAEEVSDAGAKISIYSDESYNGLIGGNKNKRKIGSTFLERGEESQVYYLPGLGCFASMKLRLDDIGAAEDFVTLKINGQYYDLVKGENFLDNKCRLKSMENNGAMKTVVIICQEDPEGGASNILGSSRKIVLSYFPAVNFEINGKLYSNVSVGDYLYSSDDGSERVYLAYLDSSQYSEDQEKTLTTYVVALSDSNAQKMKNVNKLDSDIVDYYSYIFSYMENTGNPDVGEFTKAARAYESIFFGVIDLIAEAGKAWEKIDFEELADFRDHEIKLVGYSSGINRELNRETADYYHSAVDSYDEILESYINERYPEDDEKTVAEKALREKIELASSLGQNADVLKWCEDFSTLYKDLKSPEICSNEEEISNRGVSSQEITINGQTRKISLKGIHLPSMEDYRVDVLVRYPDGTKETFSLTKDMTAYLKSQSRFNEDHVFTIRSIGSTPIYFKYSKQQEEWEWSLDDKNWMNLSESRVTGGVFRGQEPSSRNKKIIESLKGKNFEEGEIVLDNGGQRDSIRLVEITDQDHAVLSLRLDDKSNWQNTQEYFSGSDWTFEKGVAIPKGDYTFTIQKIEYKQYAKISIVPSIKNSQSRTNFSFKIGIEKRGIKLSPSVTKRKIESLNKTIEDWEKISSSLGDVVQTMKTTCLATGTLLTIENLLKNSGGKAIARQEVMKGKGGWNEECEDAEYNGKTYSSKEKCLLENANKIEKEVNEYQKEIDRQNDKIRAIEKGKTYQSNFLGEKTVDSLKSHNYNFEDLKEIDMYYSLWKSTGDKKYLERLYSSAYDIKENYENSQDLKSTEEEDKIQVKVLDSDKIKRVPLAKFIPLSQTGYSKCDNSDLNAAIIVRSKNADRYLLIFDDNGIVSKTFLIKNDQCEEEGESNPLGIRFVKSSVETYKNEYIDPVVKYYEAEPYKGLPALVPFSIESGWYAYVEQTLPIGGRIASYDDSGAVRSYWICNVGENGREEFYAKGEGDDTCVLVNEKADQPVAFTGLSDKMARSLFNAAQNAIQSASRQYESAVKSGRVKIALLEGGTAVLKAGEPATNNPPAECSDFMSVKDCQLLFNVCDPVICPSSRCDLGGAYPVKDVTQSGIIGSIVLCFPNINEGIYVPVCLTGIKAGIDGWLSITKSYKDCLEQSLETGETVGICDEVNSIYMCEFFWEQALPIVKLAIPKILGVLTGQNGARGGGEYQGVEAAWENAKSSVDYFTQSYALNSYKAFKARSTGEIGSAICKNYVSLTYPEGSNFLDVLTKADSPPQFNGRFDEIPFTTVTNPPISHYKVFYHIYAGNDQGVYFKVYLRGDVGSFYQDGGGRIVASGYITRGEYKTETVDFTAPQGFNELCISVNGQEECDFGQVSTNFAFDYVEDQYLKRQVNKTVHSKKECVSGSADWYQLVNPNFEEGARNMMDPQLYNEGIIRICATDNPGSVSDPNYGTSEQRWVDVGDCGDRNVRCWIDRKSIPSAFEFDKSAQDALKSTTDRYINNMFNSSPNLLDSREFLSKLDNLSKMKDPSKRLDFINGFIDDVFFSNERAEILRLKGEALGLLAKKKFGEYVEYLDGRKNALGISNLKGRNKGITLENGDLPLSYLDRKGKEFLDKMIGSGLDISESPELNLNEVSYKFFGGEWHWLVGSGQWLNVSNPEIQEGIVKLNDEEKRINVKLMEAESAQEGISILMDEVSKKNAPLLSTEWVTFFGDGVFSVKSRGLDSKERKKQGFDKTISFFYSDGEWYWSISRYSLMSESKYDGSRDWHKCSEPLGNSESYLNNFEVALISILGEYKSSMEYLIFWLDLSGYEDSGDLFEGFEIFGEKWTLEDAMCYAQDLDSNLKYSDNQEIKKFIDGLCANNILDDSQCTDVKGDGSWFLTRWANVENPLKDVEKILYEKSYNEEGRWTYSSAFLRLKNVKKLRYIDNPSLIIAFHSDGLINDSSFESIKSNLDVNLVPSLAADFKIKSGCNTEETQQMKPCVAQAKEEITRNKTLVVQKLDSLSIDSIINLDSQEIDIIYVSNFGGEALENKQEEIERLESRGITTIEDLSDENLALVYSNRFCDVAQLANTCEVDGESGYCLDMNEYECSSGFERGYCPNDPDNVRCCTGEYDKKQQYDPQACSNQGGACLDVNNYYCSTGFKTLMCPGASNIQCCMEGSQPLWNFKNALERVKKFDPDSYYILNTPQGDFIDQICDAKFCADREALLTEEECMNVKGDGDNWWQDFWNFPEKMSSVQELLQEKYDSSGEDMSLGEGGECLEPSQSDPFEAVADSVNCYTGAPVVNAAHCFDALKPIYNYADTIWWCKYSDKDGKVYTVTVGSGEYEKEVNITTGGSKYSTNYYSCVNKFGGEGDLPEEDKLNLLEKGDIISFYYWGGPHSAIFLNWVDKEKHEATLFDWSGRDDSGNRIYRTYEADLSDDKHPVYMFWEPRFSSA